MLRLSLAARITLIVAIALMAGWIGMIALFYWLYDADTDGAAVSARQIAAIAELIERTPDEARPDVLAAVTSATLEVGLAPPDRLVAAAARAPNADGEMLRAYTAVLGGRPLAIVAPPPSAMQKRFPRLFAIAAKPIELRIGLSTGETLVAVRRSPLVVNRSGLPLGFGAGLLGTLIALVALIVMHRQTRPLARLAAAVDRMDLGGPPAPLPRVRTTAPEIQALVTAFDRLQVRLSQLLRARMAMLGGISHDVRTFATRLRLRVDHMPEGVERDRAIADIADMVHLLDDAVLASRAGAGELAEELVEFDEIVSAEVEDRRRAGAAIELAVRCSPAAATVLGDRIALRRVVSNLADNALKYGQAAHVSLDRNERTITLTVDDEGAGIAPDRRDLLLEPFVRLEASRNRRTGGAGLGLAIVRNLVEAHGGSIAIDDAPSGGARFVVRLPLFIVAARPYRAGEAQRI